ncbi:hypothetical protein CR513_34929, partial [Mucuna pruriens]
MAAEGFKIERVLIDQGSSANILYGSTYRKLGLWDLKKVSGCLYGFSGERVPIQGTVEIETTYGEGSNTRRIRVYPTAGGVGAIWADSSVAKRCYQDSLRVGQGRLAVNTLSLELDSRCHEERERPLPVEKLKEVQVGPLENQRTRVGTTMTKEQEAELVQCLQQNSDVFAWSPQDMPGIDPKFMNHKLSIAEGARPIVQKKRKQGEEKRRAIKEETEKLLKVGFIREVRYPEWLANVVMVRKANRRWRMCMDYTDLNKVCPKDPYPLSNIDRLVDNVSGYEFLRFMDAYSGYNQIRMHPGDEEKTAFITDSGAFCYRVMPFGLKNAGATYQRLMDKIFKEVSGQDIEVYVDDMVAKSEGGRSHCEALRRVYRILRRHQLRLNPEKCSFGVQAGRFLGYMLTKRGIEANPEKCGAVISMRSPQNVKEV